MSLQIVGKSPVFHLKLLEGLQSFHSTYPICNIQTETEEHFILFCLKFRKRRLKVIRNIGEINASIYNIPHSSRFIYVMNNQNVEIIKLVMDFLLKAYTDRALILKGKL